MKRIIPVIIILSLVITAVSCGKTKKNSSASGDATYETVYSATGNAVTEKTAETTGTKTETPASSNGGQSGSDEPLSLELIDENEPVEIAGSGTCSHDSDGTTYEGSYRIAKIKHQTLRGAEAINKEIEDYFNENYAAYFAEDGGGDYSLKVDYTEVYQYDILVILITAERYIVPANEPICDYKAFFYDALCDAEIEQDEYLAYLGHSASEVYNKLYETNEGISESEYAFAVMTDSVTDENETTIDTFNVYFNGAHGDKVYTVSLERLKPDLSDMGYSE